MQIRYPFWILPKLQKNTMKPFSKWKQYRDFYSTLFSKNKQEAKKYWTEKS